MKKIFVYILAVTVVAACFIYNNFYKKENIKEIKKEKNKIKEVVNIEEDIETRGVFISYIEYEKYFRYKSNNEIEDKIEEIINNLDKYKINTIYLQVRMFSDSIYNSKIFPFTDSIANYQGEDRGIDILSLFIKYAKEKNIKIYAWINPYRISSNTDTTQISQSNPAYQYLNTNHVKVIDNKGIYYNPASSIVKNLIISGIVEIVNNYDIKGIIFDDYFYPDDTIDLDNYKEVENTISIKDYRLSQVNELVSRIYKTIKAINKNVEFGISPDANIDNDYNMHYADVKKWLSEDGYIDFIMPQVYYGFNNEVKPYIKTLNEWSSLIKNNVKLIVALSFHKCGIEDIYAKSGKNEWMESTDIIKKEIEYARGIDNYSGYSLFRYDYLVDYKNDNMKSEVENYLELTK